MEMTAQEAAIADLADELHATAELSWRRFCQQLDGAPLLWPARIRMVKTVRAYDGLPASVLGEMKAPRLRAVEGKEYRATSNRHGAVCAVVGGHLLGVKPAEFEIVTWQEERPASEEFRIVYFANPRSKTDGETR